MTSFSERLAAIDTATLTPLVRQALRDDTAAVTDFTIAPFGGGFATGTVGGYGTYKVSGTAGTKPWTLVLKVLGRIAGAGSDDPREWNYWKREVLAYQSGLLGDLPEGISAPRCFGVTSHPGDEYWVWLEYAAAAPQTWDIAHHARAARHLGRFNGAYLTGRPLPDRPWFTRGRVRNWLDLSFPILDDLAAHLAGRTRRHWLTPRTAEAVQTLWRNREPVLAALDALPRTLCHHDAFPRNLFVGDTGTTAIDWQIMGTGAVGEEIIPLICVSVQLMHIPAAQMAELEGAVFAAYVDGLRDAGWRGEERDVRLGYTAGASLFGGVSTAGMWSDITEEQGYRECEALIGAPIDSIIDSWAEMQEHYLKLAAEAAQLIERR